MSWMDRAPWKWILDGLACIVIVVMVGVALTIAAALIVIGIWAMMWSWGWTIFPLVEWLFGIETRR